MANEKFVLLEHLGIVKGYIDEKDAKALKNFAFANNKLKLFTTADASGEPAGEIDFPEEMFLDQAKTTFVENFAWSNTTYPGSTDPSLNGKPVLVLAVKGDTTVNYSFVSLASLVSAFEGEATSSASVTVANGKIKADIKISAAEGNALTVNDDGLMVTVPETTLTYATTEEVQALFNTTNA